MEWIVSAMLGAALLIAAIVVMRQRRRAWVEAGRALSETLDACRTLLALLAHFQQHRGMSSAWLAGDKGFGSKLDSKAREIEALFESLGPVARRESGKPHPCLTLNELALFRHRWAGLRDELAGLTVEQSIARHSGLIEQLLHWLAALGEARVEPLLGEAYTRRRVRNYASRLPALTECLGQARAVGMSVATRRACSAVARVRLMFLIARAESLLGQAVEGSTRSAPAEHARLAVQQMATVVRSRMLLSSAVDVTVEEYFALATRAVDAVFALIAEHGEQLAGSGGQAFPTGLAPAF